MNTPELERVVVEVFGGCNYTCQMCPQATGRGAAFTRKMPFELFEAILDQIMELGRPVIQLEGSGEATVAPDLDRYIEACTIRGLPSYLYTNGALVTGDHMKRMIDAGLDYIRFSVIGYDRETYKQWMDVDNFDLIRNNIKETWNYINESESSCQLSTYHLVLDNDMVHQEILKYRSNIGSLTDGHQFIWKQHNWSGNLPAPEMREGLKRTCGRPFANELTIRAGGNNGHRGAVTPCCQTMGPPNEAASVLGHLDDQSILEVWNGDAYTDLRKAHADEDFDRISYCKDCDFLIDDPEVLVWTNDPTFKVKGMLGTKIDLGKGLTTDLGSAK